MFAVLTDNSLWEDSSLNPGGWANLSPAGTILSISAITDAAGADDVYAITANRNLWEHTPAGWAMLSGGAFQSVSAGRNGAGQAVVYGVLTDASLWENNPAFAGDHWQNLSPAGTILGVSAAASDQVFAITADHHLWQHTPSAGWSLTSAGSFASISGEDNGGQGEVFAVLSDALAVAVFRRLGRTGHGGAGGLRTPQRLRRDLSQALYKRAEGPPGNLLRSNWPSTAAAHHREFASEGRVMAWRRWLQGCFGKRAVRQARPAGLHLEALEQRCVPAAWVPQVSGVSSELRDVWGSGPGDVFAVGLDNLILHSANDGATWAARACPPGNFLGVGGSGPDVFAVGLAGGILHSGNDGGAWAAQTSGTTQHLFAVRRDRAQRCARRGRQRGDPAFHQRRRLLASLGLGSHPGPWAYLGK